MRSVLEAAIRECLTLTSPCSLSRYVSSSRKSAERKQTRGISTNAHNIEETALPYESNKGKQQSIASEHFPLFYQSFCRFFRAKYFVWCAIAEYASVGEVETSSFMD